MALPLMNFLNFLSQRSTAVDLSQPWITVLQFHGLIPIFLLGTLWIISGYVRLQYLNKLKKKKLPPSPLDKSNNRKSLLPPITIVLPTRGYRPNSIANWEAILKLEYSDGVLEFLFVLESRDDPAHAIVTKIAKHAESYGLNRTIKIIFSGYSTQSSQKIHNLITGINSASPASKYVLCLDDDVHLHPGVLLSLITDMDASPDLRVATGYPFDVPGEGAGVLSYAALAYHLPLVIGFSVRERTHFVWGGFMLFRLEDLRGDRLGFISAWSDGGYSDDLTIAARCTELGLHAFCPSYAIFPQYMDAHWSPYKYWNYLRRQLVVLDTYSSDHNRRTNHTMAVLHCYFSWAFVIPCLFVGARIMFLILGSSCGMKNDKNDLSFYLFIGLFAYMVNALCWMTNVFCSVLEELNPKILSLSSDSVGSNGRKTIRGVLFRRFNWIKLWAGFIAANAVLPLCMIYTFATRHIEWAGVRYRRHNGKVIAVQHS